MEAFESQQISNSNEAAPSVGGQKSEGSNNSKSARYQGEVTSHKHQVVFKIENGDDLPNDDRWRQRWIENSEKNWQHDETNDTYYCWINDWKARLTKQRVYIHIPERRKQGVANVMQEVLEDAYEARDWIEQHSKPRLQLSSYPVSFDVWMSEHHLGLVDHPLAQWITRQEGLSKKDFAVYVDGEKRVFTDDTPRDTLEAASDYKEEDMRHLEDRMEWILKNKEVDKELRESIPDRTDDLEKWMKFLLQIKTVESLGGIGQRGNKHSRTRNESEERQTGCHSQKFEGGKCEQKAAECNERSEEVMSTERDERLKKLEKRMENRVEKLEEDKKGE